MYVNIKETALRNVKQIFIWHHFACLWRALFYTWHCSRGNLREGLSEVFFYEYEMICTIMVQLNAFTLLKVMCLFFDEQKEVLRDKWQKKRICFCIELSSSYKKNMKSKLFHHKYIFPFMTIIMEKNLKKLKVCNL